MRRKYIYNPDTLDFEPLQVNKSKRISVLLIVIILSFISGALASTLRSNVIQNPDTVAGNLIPSKHDDAIGTYIWKKNMFDNYTQRANLWLSRPEFNGTPLTGEILALAAWNCFDSTGILVPVELALAQAQYESSMGLKGRSPKTNPYNVGEYNSKTVLWFDSTFDGVQAYYYLIANNYLKCRSLEELFTSFENCFGHKYARCIEDCDQKVPYEIKLARQYYFIKQWLKKNLKKKKGNLL